jgi:hypothetical protein
MVRCLDLEFLLGIFIVYVVFGLSFSRQKTVCRATLVNEVDLITPSVPVFAVVRESIYVVGNKITDNALWSLVLLCWMVE